MIKFILAVLVLLNMHQAIAQLKTTPTCPVFNVDVLEGSVNELYAKSTLNEIKTLFPCFDNLIEETTGFECGGIFYKEKGINFFTERDYIEINEKFKGKMSLPLMGKNRNGLFAWLGHPKIKDINWDAFQTKYGILILYYNKTGKVNKVQISTRTTDTIKLCE